MSNQKGSAYILILATLLVVFSLVLGGLYIKNNYPPNVQPLPTPQLTTKPNPTTNPTANWQTYTNSKYNFSIKYPNYSEIQDDGSRGLFISGKTDLQSSVQDSSESVADLEWKKNFMIRISVNDSQTKVSKDKLSQDPLQYSDPRFGGNKSDYSLNQNTIKPYLNNQIDGIIYQVNYDNGDQTASYEEIEMIKGDFIYTFDINNGQDIPQGTGREAAEKILSTFKFLDQTTNSFPIDPKTGWRIFRDESTLSAYNSPKIPFSIEFPPEWLVEENVLYPLGKEKQGIDHPLSIGLEAPAIGLPPAQEIKAFPAGKASYYWGDTGNPDFDFGYAVFDNGFGIFVSLVPKSQGQKYQDIVNQVLNSLKFI